MTVANMLISVLSWGIILRFINISLCCHKLELSGENAVSKNSTIQFDAKKHRVSVSRKKSRHLYLFENDFNIAYNFCTSTDLFHKKFLVRFEWVIHTLFQFVAHGR